MRRIVNTLNGGKHASALLLCAATAIAIPAQTTFTVLHNFDGTDGAHPEARLVQATNGDLYGTTYSGGAKPVHSTVSPGTAFKISPSGTFKTIHSFCSQTDLSGDCLDGVAPMASLLQAPNGDLYGTTPGGGDNDNCLGDGATFLGCGIVFKMTLSGTVTAIYDFCTDGTGESADCADGYNPSGALIQAPNGNFYGTTKYGAPQFCGAGYNCWGTVFEISGSGTLNTLYNFCKGAESPCPSGASPAAGLIQDTNGDFYGMTQSGGEYGAGALFKITSAGAFTTLYSFCQESGCPDGSVPNAALILGHQWDLYGVTPSGGAHGGGTVFQTSPGGALATLYSFCTLSECADGEVPTGLIQGSDGNFYGTTTSGGSYGKGTVFEITSAGTPTTLYSFCKKSGCADGASPSAGLVQDTNGTFFGTTKTGGANNEGTVFSLSVGLGPFVETQTTSGAVGKDVNILGTDLTGASSSISGRRLLNRNGTGDVELPNTSLSHTW